MVKCSVGGVNLTERKNAMKKIIAIIALAAMIPLSAAAETVVYKLSMTLKVPRVYDNTTSKGYRKINSQTITGYVYVDKDNLVGNEPVIFVSGMLNKTHKINGKNVTYADTEATDVMWRYIGSNKTGVFKNTCVKFSLDLDPSYNIGDDEPDNALIVTLAAQGSSEKTLTGNVTGQIGCGCKAYGHVSPTRTIGCYVDDKVPLYGTFKMKRVTTCK